MERVFQEEIQEAYKDAAENGGEVITGYIERHHVSPVMVWHVVALLNEMGLVVAREEACDA